MAVPESNRFSTGEALSYGWKKLQENVGPLLTAALAILAVNVIFWLLGSGFLGGLFKLIGWFVSILISMGVIRIALKIVDGRPVETADLFQRADQALPYFIASVIVGIMVGIGFIFLIIPGIYLAITFGFFGYNIVDKEHGIVESIEQSAAITRAQKGDLFVFGVALFLFNLAGAIALGIGLLITVPVSMLALAYVYRKLSGEPVTP
ncbi:MAG: hypothetical protein ACXW1Y_09285 [Acidimicrobiia bacterium]